MLVRNIRYICANLGFIKVADFTRPNFDFQAFLYQIIVDGSPGHFAKEGQPLEMLQVITAVVAERCWSAFGLG